MIDVETWPQVVADYESGATTRELAAKYGGDPSSIGKRLRANGVAMRPRGAKPATGNVAETVLTMRRSDHATWEQIAQATGRSVRGVQLIYERESGSRSHLVHYRDLTARQAAELSSLLERMDRVPHGGLDWQSQTGQRFAAAVRRLHNGGVTYASAARACGISADQLHYALRLHAPMKPARQ